MLAQSLEPEAHDKVLGIWKCWFLRRGENRSTWRKTSWSKDKNQQQTQPTYNTESGNRTRATLVRGECSHHCAISTPFVLHIVDIGSQLHFFPLQVEARARTGNASAGMNSFLYALICIMRETSEYEAELSVSYG